jgi:hypothetical protein
MTALEKIKQAVSKLSPEEINAFADWFAEFDSRNWDKQFVEDARTGRLDKFAKTAIAHHMARRTTPL